MQFSVFKESTMCFLCGDHRFETMIWCITKSGMWQEMPVCADCDFHITGDWIHGIPGVEIRVWPNNIHAITLRID